jgi:membrane associated rhomboid family serine protease
MSGWLLTYWIILVNVVVFFVGTSIVVTATLESGQQVRYQPVFAWGWFSLRTAIYSGQVWRFLSFQFLHGGFEHLFFNMLGLFFFGRLVEQYLGTRRYLAFYLLSGIGGPIAYVVLYYLGVLRYSPDTPLIGASAGLFGVLIAAAMIAPHARVQLLFPPIEMTMRQMAWLYLGIAAAIVLWMGRTGTANAGGEAAHLGGAAVGYLLMRNPSLLRFADSFRLPSRGPRMRIAR